MFNVWNQTSTHTDTGKDAVFFRVLEIAQPDHTRRDSPVNRVIRTLSRIDGAFINLPLTEARDYVWSFRKPTIWRHQGQMHSELDAQTTRCLF